jgi:WD40 repeat protein
VFDHDLTFKGYLESNFATVAGMDFDAAGHLVAVGSGSAQKVRVYESSGAVVGGFTRSDKLLGAANDLKVAPNGNYIVATQDFGGGDGAREFMPEGTYVRQFGTGDITGVAVLPGNRLWIGGIEGIGIQFIHVYDLTTGAPIGSLPVPHAAVSMTYSASTNTVLATSAGRIHELDLQGSVLRTFTAPGASLSSATRGPNGDVFATDGFNEVVVRWHADGQFVGSVSTGTVLGGAGGIVWTGNVPEPGGAATFVGLLARVMKRARRA